MAVVRGSIGHLRKPGVNAQRPETLIGYGEALELLKLPANAPRGPTDGKTLQLNGLNDLAQWVNRHPRMPRITGMIISRSEYDGIDGIRRPRNVPSAGYFREYKRKIDDWQWWIEQVEASLAFDWSPLLSTTEQREARFVLPTPTRFEHLRPTRSQRVYDLLQEAGLKTEIVPGDAQGNGLAAHRSYLSQWSFLEGQRIVLCLHFQDTLYTPLYLSGLVTSAVLLGLLRQREYSAEKAELVQHFDTNRRMFLCRRSHRVRVGVAPLLSFGRPGTARFLSPTFLLSVVLPREPMSIFPFTLSWLFLLADAPGWAAIAVFVGVAWRAVIDAALLPKDWSSEERIETIKVKIAWCLLSGVWLASLAAYGWAVLLGLMLVLAMCAAGATKSRRSKW